ncbi:serine hydrolase domain-containing protein [Halomontanus rarus]|uniref:serine hydrolase domain-containing protein n=1 Tax=Halomontanus rarus TaxID=3034020 RepID=UPI0023E88B72|nr:serine hydrolase domain-containing protein [Halovivax sp. TS33]
MPVNHAADDRDRIGRLLEDGLDDHFTCAAAAIGGPGGDPLTVSVGDRDPAREAPVTPDTRFDLASLTKPIATTTLVFQLLEAGAISFNDTLADHVPALKGTDRESIPIHTLLTHTSGLRPYAYDESWDSRESSMADLLERDLRSHPIGDRFEYSCLNFVHLEEVVRRVTGESLSDLARRRIFEPAGMTGATMGPPEFDVPVVATYDHDHADRRLVGETNDPIARAMGGYSGNAGLFATLEDVVAFAETMLREGETPDGERILSPASVRSMRRERARSDEVAQGYGWRTPIGRTPAPIWGADAIGHTGYTGTSLWLDFDRERYAVCLTNAAHEAVPDLERFRQRFHAVAASIESPR